MPTYEYECKECGKVFEVFQSINQPPLEECPHCHAKSPRRLIGTGAGIIFKGSGFYATDYRKTAQNSKKEEKTPTTCPKAASGECSACA